MSSESLELIKERITKLETCYGQLTVDVTSIKTGIEGLKANYDLAKLLIQWIIAPLVIILGALVGIKTVFPSL